MSAVDGCKVHVDRRQNLLKCCLIKLITMPHDTLAQCTMLAPYICKADKVQLMSKCAFAANGETDLFRVLLP